MLITAFRWGEEGIDFTRRDQVVETGAVLDYLLVSSVHPVPVFIARPALHCGSQRKKEEKPGCRNTPTQPFLECSLCFSLVFFFIKNIKVLIHNLPPPLYKEQQTSTIIQSIIQWKREPRRTLQGHRSSPVGTTGHHLSSSPPALAALPTRKRLCQRAKTESHQQFKPLNSPLSGTTQPPVAASSCLHTSRRVTVSSAIAQPTT